MRQPGFKNGCAISMPYSRAIEWVPEKLRRAYKRQPAFDAGESERRQERATAAQLRPRSEAVSIFPTAPPLPSVINSARDADTPGRTSHRS